MNVKLDGEILLEERRDVTSFPKRELSDWLAKAQFGTTRLDTNYEFGFACRLRGDSFRSSLRFERRPVAAAGVEKAPRHGWKEFARPRPTFDPPTHIGQNSSNKLSPFESA